jgi:hypothetical protein
MTLDFGYAILLEINSRAWSAYEIRRFKTYQPTNT